MLIVEINLKKNIRFLSELLRTKNQKKKIKFSDNSFCYLNEFNPKLSLRFILEGYF